MWKSGWNLDREWVKRNEKWLILLVLGLAILILYAPFGKKTSETLKVCCSNCPKLS